jgi:hypothetical protein
VIRPNSAGCSDLGARSPESTRARADHRCSWKTLIATWLIFAEGYRDMLDTILIAAGVGFFVAAVLYVLACDRM